VGDGKIHREEAFVGAGDIGKDIDLAGLEFFDEDAPDVGDELDLAEAGAGHLGDEFGGEAVGLTGSVDKGDRSVAALDAELDNMRARFGTLVPVDRPAAKGDFVELDLVATIGGTEIDMESRTYVDHLAGLVREGSVPESLLDDDTTPVGKFFVRNNGQVPDEAKQADEKHSQLAEQLLSEG
jgi:hypothetical protein